METKDDQLKKIDQKIKDLKKLHHDTKKSIERKKSQNLRKERARRLIETGALAEKYFEITNLDISEREDLFKIFSSFIKANKPNHLKIKTPLFKRGVFINTTKYS
ncbi:hypothetical protein ACT7CM_27045 [Bacillus paranthracis]